MKKVLLSFYFLLSACYAFSQQSKIDSLLSLLKKDQDDTNKVNHLNALGWELMNSNPDTAIILSNQALVLANSLPSGGQGWASNSLGNLGAYYGIQADYPKALGYFLKALRIDEELNNKEGIAKRLGNIGLVYWNQGDYPKALDYYFKALKMAEELGNKNRIAIQLGNIGNVYTNQGDYPKALDYYFKALKVDEELGDKKRIAGILGNIGIIYHEQGDYPKALDYYFRALKIAEELGNKNGIAIWLGNIGSVYSDEADKITGKNNSNRKDSLKQKALDYYFKALKMAEELGDKNSIATNLGNIGSLYTETGKFKEAEVYLKEAIALDDSIGALDRLMDAEESLSQLYDTTSRYQLALIHYKKAMVLKDTLFSEEKNKEITRKEMNYEFEKKEAAAAAAAEKQQAVEAAEKKKQQVILWSVVSGLLIVVVFAGFIFRALRITQKQKQLIEQQKKIVEEKQNEILASIRYAKRIQDAILPTEKYIDKTLKRLMKK